MRLVPLLAALATITAAEPTTRRHDDLEYARIGNRSLKLDLRVPTAHPGCPLVVFIHGGGWTGGDKSHCPAWGALDLGFAVASISYRFAQEAPWPAQIHDCKAAIRWLRNHAKDYGYDGARIGVWGQSAGGHLAAMLGTTGDVQELEGSVGETTGSSRVQAVIDWFGPADFLVKPGEDWRQRLATFPDSSPLVRLMGGRDAITAEKLRSASPVAFASADDPPFLIMHGGKDGLVPIEQSRSLDATLRKAGVRSQLVEFPDDGHGGSSFGRPETALQLVGFFVQHLKARKDAVAP